MLSRKDFFQAKGSLVRKRKVHKMKVVTQYSAIKNYHEFHANLNKDLEIAVTPIPLLPRVIP